MLIAKTVMQVAFASLCAFRNPPPTPVPVWNGPVSPKQIPAHRLFLSPDLRDLVVLVHTPPENRLQPKVIPLNIRFDPVVSVAVLPKQYDSSFTYQYSIANGSSGSDAIAGIFLVVGSNIEATVAEANKDWVGAVSIPALAQQSEIQSAERGRFVTWSVRGLDEMAHAIKPKSTQGGFAVTTALLPGFTTMYLAGRQIDVDEGGVDGVEVTAVMADVRLRTLSVLTLGPMFSKETSCAEILKNYRLGLSRLEDCAKDTKERDWLRAVDQLIDKQSCSTFRSDLRSLPSPPSPKGIEAEIVNCLRLVADATSK